MLIRSSQDVTCVRLSSHDITTASIDHHPSDDNFFNVRFLDINAEEALKTSIYKFENRFHGIENFIKNKNNNFDDYSDKELNKLWEQMK